MQSTYFTSHSKKHLRLVTSEMTLVGVFEYRFCIENDCYVCDVDGNFYSICTRQFSKSGNLVEKYRVRKLTGSIDKDGYSVYRIVTNGLKKHLKGHRMMLNAWVGERQDLVVNHIDGNKTNNSLGNLEWCTVAENNAHAIALGLFDPYSIKQKYVVAFADWVTIYILKIHLNYSLTELGKMYRCSRGAIKSIIQRLDKVLPVEVTQ